MKMNIKNLFGTLLLCLTVVFADSNFKGNCNDLEKSLKKNNKDGVNLFLHNCNHDKNGNAVEYEITIECSYSNNQFTFNQSLFDNLSTYTNLEKLSLYDCRVCNNIDKLNFEPLKKLEKVTEVYIRLSSDFNIPSYFKNLKKLTYGRCAPEVISYSQIEELYLDDAEYDGYVVDFEGIPNLKSLSIISTADDAGDLDIKMPKKIKIFIPK